MDGDRQMKSKDKKLSDIIVAIVLGCLLLAAFIYSTDILGIPKSQLEKDIRSQQKISDDWTVEGTVSDQIAIYLSYPEDRSDCTYSFYLNRPGLSLGYFFCVGGSLGESENFVGELVINGYTDRAYFSMNLSKVARAEISDGSNVETIALDSDKPFTLILSVNEEDCVTFYDVDGNIVESSRHSV